MINIGFACGLALGGVLAGASYHLLFVGDAVTSGLFALIALTALPHGTRTTRHEERDRVSAGRSIVSDKGFLLVLGAVFVTAAIYMQNATTFALHVTDSRVLHAGLRVPAGDERRAGRPLRAPRSARGRRHRSRTRMIALGAVLVGLGFAELAFVKAVPGLLLDGRHLDARRDHRVAGDGGVRGGPGTDARPRPLSGRAGHDVRAGGGRRTAGGTSIYHFSPTALWIGCGVAGFGSAALALAAGRRPVPDQASIVS